MQKYELLLQIGKGSYGKVYTVSHAPPIASSPPPCLLLGQPPSPSRPRTPETQSCQSVRATPANPPHPAHTPHP